MRAFAKTLPLVRMRSAPMPFKLPLNIDVPMSRSVVVPRGGTLNVATFVADIADVEFVVPAGKNCTNAFALAVLTPKAELLKMLTSVWKFVPPTPWAEPTTGRHPSLPGARGPDADPLANPLELTLNANEHGLARICCASVELTCVDPVRRPLIGTPRVANVTIAAPPLDGMS